MMPQHVFTRRDFLSAAVSIGSLLASGCTALNIRSQSPEDSLLTAGPHVRLISDVATPFGMTPVVIEAVSMVNGLHDTGSDPPPSPERALLLAEMQTRGVDKPNQVLSSPSTDLVMVRGYLRPGIQKGDRFDIEVRVPSRSECKSLRDGWLLQTQLREMGVYEARVHQGSPMAMAQGPVLVDPSAPATDQVAQCRGRVLGGGVSLVSRELGLVLKPESKNVLVSAQVGEAINRRFHTFFGGIKEGVAKPKTNEFIEVRMHPRYKDNIDRYIRVIRSLPLRENRTQQVARVSLLEQQLLDPITSSTAAIRLEALGKDGNEALHKGLDSKDDEVRFYAAEALAYLDDRTAAAPLGELAKNVPAFRAYALAALSAMDDVAAYEALRDLLHVSSAETRYGAFRSLWAMNPNDPLVRGEGMKGTFSYHVLDTSGPDMVHVTRNHRPEIVLFGHEQSFAYPLALEVGQNMIIKSQDRDHVTVSRFSLRDPDQKRVVSHKIDDVIRAMVDLGGTYPDVVEALQGAKKTGGLTSRFEVDAVPQAGRTYVRAERGPSLEHHAEQGVLVGNPLPDLFAHLTPGENGTPAGPSIISADETQNGEKSPKTASFFGKLTGRD